MNTLSQKKNRPIKQSTIESSLLYKIETKQTITFIEETTEDTISLEVSKRFIKKDNIGYLHEILVEKREQNNIKGTRELGCFLEKLNEKIILYTNSIGQIISIANFGEINEIWTDIKNDFKKKFKSDNDIEKMIERMEIIMSNQKNFLPLFRQTEIATLLFPPIFIKDLVNSNDQNQYFQHKIFPFFYGKYSLPIKLITSLNSQKKIQDSTLSISRVGIINEDIFDEKAVKTMFRNYYKNPTIIADITCKYGEMFYLNNENIIQRGTQLLNTAVGDMFQFGQFTNISFQS